MRDRNVRNVVAAGSPSTFAASPSRHLTSGSAVTGATPGSSPAAVFSRSPSSTVASLQRVTTPNASSRLGQANPTSSRPVARDLSNELGAASRNPVVLPGPAGGVVNYQRAELRTVNEDRPSPANREEVELFIRFDLIMVNDYCFKLFTEAPI